MEDVYYSSAWSRTCKSFYYVRPRQGHAPLAGLAPCPRYPGGPGPTGVPGRRRTVFCLSRPHQEHEFRPDHERIENVDRGPLFTVGQRPRPSVGRNAHREGVEYDVDHAVDPANGDIWLVRSNRGPSGEDLETFALFELPVGANDPAHLRPLIPYRPAVKLESVDAFARHALVLERSDGLEHLRVLRLADGAEHVVAQPEPAYKLSGEAGHEWDTDVARFGYSSLTSPPSSVEYNMETRQRSTVKQATVGGGYDARNYRSERLWAEAPDGTLVPISLVCRRDQPLDGSAPCLLYGYGSYEYPVDPSFSRPRLNLLERGFVFAIAHVRGRAGPALVQTGGTKNTSPISSRALNGWWPTGGPAGTGLRSGEAAPAVY